MAPAPAPLSGIGLRTPHQGELLSTRPQTGFLEVHSENYFGGGRPVAALERLRPDYAISLHGVGLSLGGAEPLSRTHLDRLASLVARVEPWLVSEHLAWVGIGGLYLNDLLPLPLTEESLDVMTEHVDQVQHRLNRQILIENPSAYLAFTHSPIPEAEFLAALVARSGCAILLDVNNLHVSATNNDLDIDVYLGALPAHAVAEIHLAGHDDSGPILIDTHDRPVPDPVWALYDRCLALLGDIPTLVEWDAALPSLATLLGQARIADAHRRAAAQERAGHHASAA